MFRGHHTIPLILAALASLLLGPALVSGQQQETISLDALIRELLQANPEIQAAGYRYDASLTRPSRESALPDPRLSFGWMSAGTILPGGKLGEDPNANINLQVSQEFPFPGKRGLMAEIARKDSESEKQMRAATVRSRIAALRTAYYDLSFTYQALELLNQNQQSLRQLSKVAEVRYTVGKAMQQDLIKSETEVAILQNRILALQQQQQSLIAEINTLLNRPADSSLGRPAPVLLPALDSYDLLVSRIKTTSPLLLSQQSGIEKQQTSVRLAGKGTRPDFEIMMGYYNLGKLQDMWEVRAGISLPIFYKTKQRKQLEEATLQLGEAKQNYRAASQMLEFKLRDAYVKAQTSRNLMDLYDKQIVPQSNLALESSMASYETGGVDFLTVLSNFTVIREYRMNRLEQEANYLKALALIDELTGGEEAQS